MKNNNLQPNETFDSLRGTGRHAHVEPTFVSYSSLEDYCRSHAGNRFILAKIGVYYRYSTTPCIEIWEDLPLDHDHMFQSVRLILKFLYQWAGVARIRVDFATDVINPFQITVFEDAMPIDIKK